MVAELQKRAISADRDQVDDLRQATVRLLRGEKSKIPLDFFGINIIML